MLFLLIIICIIYILLLSFNNNVNCNKNLIDNTWNSCIDIFLNCSDYVKENYCNIMPKYMIDNCVYSCNYCHLVDTNYRCSVHMYNIINNVSSIIPGDINKLFNYNIESNYNKLFNIGKRLNLSKKKIKFIKNNNYNHNNIAIIDNFLSEFEIEQLLNIKHNWERSTELCNFLYYIYIYI